MKLRYRFGLIAIGIIIFAIVTPVAVLFARGWKYDFAARKIVKTGTLVVRSEPNRAEVIIETEDKLHRTPATIRFLLPGDYNITIQKTGYQSWTKRLNIRSQFATWANLDREFITLFYAQPQTISRTTADQIAGSQTDNSIAYVHENKIYALNVERGSISPIGDFPAPATGSPVGLDAVSRYYWLRWQDRLQISAEAAAGMDGLRANDRFAAYTANGQLSAGRLGSLIPIRSSVTGFTLENEFLWFTAQTQLYRLNLDSGALETMSADLPVHATASIIRTPDFVFLLLDQALYLVNQPLEKIRDGIAYAAWDGNSRKLVMANANEIATFDPGSFISELILRSSTPVSQPLLNHETGYIFFSNEDKIKAIELDGRDHRNIYTIADDPGYFLISGDGVRLYTFGQQQITSYEIR